MKKILIIDDEYPIREMYKSIFSSLGHEVETAKNGLDGFIKVSVFRPDGILLDVNMPEMTGPEFAKKLSEDPDPYLKNIPFIVLTGESYNDAPTQHLFRGNTSCKAFLPKMADPDLVVRSMMAILGSPEQEAQQ
ncbi:MAG TPA: response regulator [Elusimicrobiales bacterium]|nr:response regulator [Elusimicrobiales bacterium]